MTAAGDLVYQWDLATDRIAWGGETEQLFGRARRRTPLDGKSFAERINAEDQSRRSRVLAEHFAGGDDYDVEYRVRADSGEFNWVHDRGQVERDGTGEPLRVHGTLRRITRRKLNEARLEYLANFDELTGHFNKLRLREALEYALADALRARRSGAFLAVGIDSLDRINRAYGSELGDGVLVEIGRRLDRCLRTNDVVGRLGGDRFGVVLNGCTAAEALHTAERILTVVRRSAVDTAAGPIHVSVSTGILLFPGQAHTALDAIARAEGALLKAKTAGRDCAALYELTEEQERGFRDAMEIGEQVKTALKEGRLQLAFQPIVAADGGSVDYYECLVRMRATDGRLVPAASFIPVVEQLGLMRAIDRYVLDLALEELTAVEDVRLGINISGLTAADRSWLRALNARLRGRSDLARRLIVEITETAALHDVEDTARFVQAVRELGCQVAIDDFGAGYTTFRHLKALTVDIVKIDGSFVRGVLDSPQNQLFVRNLLSLAKAFNLRTVAECVETAEEAEFLADEGVDLLQGYHFGRPEMLPPWRAAPGVATARRARPDGLAGSPSIVAG
ncbi:putative bifunctional diguanylate cyclase/phosphodiesterase [Tistlia consotensis]|uniref:putative bifunctional diguanylate cyclase/phosphodiesterase n=1 Tax=Tistlia consotensis TaxID=1321365 RepID=UPI00117C44EF|nr:GGDEF domain-containing phosphodiesterase [Tistlia consotensis]